MSCIPIVIMKTKNIAEKNDIGIANLSAIIINGVIARVW